MEWQILFYLLIEPVHSDQDICSAIMPPTYFYEQCIVVYKIGTYYTPLYYLKYWLKSEEIS